MNDHEIDWDLVARYTRDAERQRSIALGQWLIASWRNLKESAAATGRRLRFLLRRRQWTVSATAPHH